MMYSRIHKNKETLDKIDSIVDYTVSNGKDIYKVVASFMFDKHEDDISERERFLVKKYMIPGSDKSEITDSEADFMIGCIKETFPYFLEIDLNEPNLESRSLFDGAKEALFMILPLWKYQNGRKICSDYIMTEC